MTTTLILAVGLGGGGYDFLIMLALMIAIFWFFIIRPQQKRQKEIQNFQNSLTTGSQVYTQGGVLGRVVTVNESDNTVVVEVAKGVHITVFKNCLFSNAPVQQQG